MFRVVREAFVILKKVPKVSSHPIGESQSNLVTLPWVARTILSSEKKKTFFRLNLASLLKFWLQEN
jgi:hypothetical protein